MPEILKTNIFPWTEKELSDKAQIVNVPSQEAANYIEQLWHGNATRIAYSFQEDQLADDFFRFLLGEIQMHRVKAELYPDTAVLCLQMNPQPTILVLDAIEAMYLNQENPDQHALFKDPRLGKFLEYVATGVYNTRAILIGKRSPHELMRYTTHYSITDHRNSTE